ncbi:STAS/SEC14 domain-containing protein [bacterium]|nr:STAS/SEC14 domain-containing protein [bacterium]
MEKAPENSRITGEIADYEFKDGILYSYSKSIKRTVPLIEQNVQLVKKITGGTPVPLLIHLTNSPVPDKETQRYSTEKLPEIYSAMAMISKPGLAFFIMKLLFKLKTPPIPMKSFTTEAEGLAWLQQFK